MDVGFNRRIFYFFYINKNWQYRNFIRLIQIFIKFHQRPLDAVADNTDAISARNQNFRQPNSNFLKTRVLKKKRAIYSLIILHLPRNFKNFWSPALIASVLSATA